MYKYSRDFYTNYQIHYCGIQLEKVNTEKTVNFVEISSEALQWSSQVTTCILGFKLTLQTYKNGLDTLSVANLNISFIFEVYFTLRLCKVSVMIDLMAIFLIGQVTGSTVLVSKRNFIKFFLKRRMGQYFTGIIPMYLLIKISFFCKSLKSLFSS